PSSSAPARLAPDLFFQAEDGIRDFHVTGVQTCALPICLEKEESDPRYLHARKMAAAERIRWHALTMNQESGGRVRNIDAERRGRSEERRVGKEWRSGGETGHEDQHAADLQHP